MDFARNREESQKEKIKLGTVEVPEGKESWMKYVMANGDVFAQPLVRRKLTDEEIAKREEAKKAKTAAYEKRIEESKERREKEREDVEDRKEDRKAERIQRLQKALAEAKK